jgi:hypothetical protein
MCRFLHFHLQILFIIPCVVSFNEIVLGSMNLDPLKIHQNPPVCRPAVCIRGIRHPGMRVITGTYELLLPLLYVDAFVYKTERCNNTMFYKKVL